MSRTTGIVIILLLVFLIYWYFRLNYYLGDTTKFLISEKSRFKFDPNATEFNLDNAGFLCEASARVYDESDSCKIWAEANGFTEKFWFIDTSLYDSNSNTAGFVAQSHDAILVVWRGTNINKVIDILTDADALLVTTWSGRAGIHQGFFRAFFKAWGQPFSDLKDNKVNPVVLFPDILRQAGSRKIWITGHSLGGAIAQVCAAETELRDGVKVQAVYTFGQPRVGNLEFAQIMQEKMGDRIFRVVNNSDIVTRMAPYSTGYRHYGKRIFFNEFGIMTSSPSEIETSDATSNILFSVTNAVSTITNILKTEISLNPKKMLEGGERPVMDHIVINYMPLFQRKVV